MCIYMQRLPEVLFHKFYWEWNTHRIRRDRRHGTVGASLMSYTLLPAHPVHMCLINHDYYACMYNIIYIIVCIIINTGADDRKCCVDYLDLAFDVHII